MYCQKCGKADQEVNSYCRQCGEFLPDMSKKRRSGQPITPDERIRMSLTFNLMSAIAGFGIGLLLLISHLDRQGTHFSVFVALSFLFVIASWQTVSFFNNWNLRKRFKQKDDIAGDHELGSQDTSKLLNEPNLENVVPASVTEKTTRNLKETIERK